MIYKQRVCDGQMSVTPQFWMICIDLMEKQYHFHTAAQEGTFGGRMCAWEFFLPFFFSTNKYNHARHGSWYKHQIRKRDSLHSVDEIIFSVQSHARYNLQTAVEQRGEQSLNKGAKTVGSIRRFSPDNDAVANWTMGRADQARNLNSLLQMCNIREQYYMYNRTRPLQILTSESHKSNVVTVLENEFANLFDIALDRTMLINLRSGLVMETPTKLQNVQQDGIIMSKRVPSRMTSTIFQKIF